MKAFTAIISDPEILGGKPIIKGTRISVELVLEWLASGGSIQSIANKHPLLTPANIQEALRYAARFSKNEVILEVKIGA